MTQMSGVRTSTTSPSPRNRSGERGGARAYDARAHPFDDHRDECDHAERRKRGKQPRRRDHADVEMDLTVGAAGREAGAVDALLRGDHTVEARSKESER